MTLSDSPNAPPMVRRCGYCGNNSVRIGITEEGMLPLCGPSVKIGLLCDHCGLVDPLVPSLEHGSGLTICGPAEVKVKVEVE